MTNRFLIYILLISVTMLGLFSCTTIPKNATAVNSFDKEKYLGKWYEVARFDFKFERNLNNTSAEYSLNENGTIKVDNQGYNTVKNQWQQSIGKAKFVRNDSTAMLKVSFFGPFYGGYNVLAIDEDYKYALIAGGSLNYLWILSRETSIPEDIKTKYLAIAEKVGYDTSKLLWIEHDKKK
ncbi:lipocalin family protein [Flavobacterium sp. W1B]|uniref:lipocalin family protein n=1 Tax=Flavobacterium sp. W1B TaxID=3394146 RepID=UPI0039BD90D0